MQTIMNTGFRGGVLALCLALCLTVPVAITQSGCGNIVNDVKHWVPVGEAALNSILAALSANGVALPPGGQLAVTEIEAGFNAVLAAVQEYQSVTPPPVGALAKLQDALAAVTDQFKAFLSSLNLPGGNILALITGLAGVIFSTVAAFAAQLPATPSMRMMAQLRTYRVSGAEYTVTPHHRTRRSFMHDWDAELDRASATGVMVPRSAYFHRSLLQLL